MNNVFVSAQRKLKLTHEASWIVDVGTDLAVNLDVTLHDDLGDFGVVQCVL